MQFLRCFVQISDIAVQLCHSSFSGNDYFPDDFYPMALLLLMLVKVCDLWAESIMAGAIKIVSDKRCDIGTSICMGLPVIVL